MTSQTYECNQIVLKMGDELLPCPLCGDNAVLVQHAPHEHSEVIKTLIPDIPPHPGSFSIECCNCSCGILEATKKDALNLWNTRFNHKDNSYDSMQQDIKSL